MNAPRRSHATVCECGFEEMYKYSPALASSDYDLFLNSKNHLSRQRFLTGLRLKNSRRCSQNYFILLALKIAEIVTKCAFTKAVNMLKNKCVSK